MNEFRSALKDQTTQFLTRKEFDIQHDRVNNDIRSLCETRAEMTGKASMKSVVIGYSDIVGNKEYVGNVR